MGFDQRPTPPDWPWALILQQALNCGVPQDMLTKLWMRTPPTEVLKAGVHAPPSLLEWYLREDALANFLIKHSRVWGKTDTTGEEWSQFLQIILSLPSRLANLEQEKMPLFCSPDQYSAILSWHVAVAFHFLSEAEEHQVDWNISCLTQLLGKLLTNYGGCSSVQNLLKSLVSGCDKTVSLTTVVRSSLFCLNDKECENAATILLYARPIDSLLGNDIPDTWKRILLQVLPFLRCHNQTALAKNLISTLIFCVKKELLIDMLCKLVSVCGNSSGMAHTSIEQQTYVADLIVCILPHVKYSELTVQQRTALLKGMSSALTNRLNSSDTNIRLIGMLVAEPLALLLHPEASPLKFEYDNTLEICKQLKAVKLISEEATTSNWLLDLKSKLGQADILMPSSKPTVTYEVPATDKLPPVLDSDDEEEDEENAPSDISDDYPPPEKPKPVYLRDAFQILIDGEKDISGLQELIEKQLPDDDPEMAEELIRALLSLEDLREGSRGKCLVATVLAKPKESVIFLGQQLTLSGHAYSYTSLCMQTLGIAVYQLFHGPPQQSSEQLQIKLPELPPKSKWIHAPRRAVTESRSRIAPVAGYFVYALLPALHCDWPTELQSQLLVTLGTVLHCTINSPGCPKFALTTIEELEAAKWPRCSPDPKIRGAAMHVIALALALLGPQQTFECRQIPQLTDWATSASNDSDSDCRQWATHALAILY
jgi:hypothetical protein